MHHLTKKRVVAKRKNDQPLLFTAAELAGDSSIVPGFTIHRDAKIDYKHEAGRYAAFAGRIAVKGLKMAGKGVAYTFTDMLESADRQRKHRAKMEKAGVKVKYTFF